MTPAFAAEYAASFRVGVMPDTDALLTIDAATALEHERHRGTHAVIRAGEVHVDEAVPELLVDGVQRPEIAEAGVVHQHVEPPEPVRDVGERGAHLVAVAHVERVGVTLDLGRDGSRRVRIAVDDGDDRALVREHHRGRPSDPRAATRDDRDTSLESVHRTPRLRERRVSARCMRGGLESSAIG